MCDARDRQIAANLTVLAHKLGARDRQIAALESMNRVLLAMLDEMRADASRMQLALNEPGEVGIERRN